MPLHISLSAETLFTIFGFPITNTIFTSWIIVGFLSVVAVIIRKAFSPVPSEAGVSVSRISQVTDTSRRESAGGVRRFSVLVEMIIGGLLGFFSTIAGSEERAKRFFPIVATIFFFVLFSNWFGIFPGVGTIAIEEVHDEKTVFVPILRTVFSDLNMTIMIALISVVLSHVIGIRRLGRGHIGKYFSFKTPITFFVGLLELVGEFAKIVSFSFRLFGNIFAGEVLLVVIAFLIPVIIPIPFMGLELFVGLIQALIFATLTMVFFTVAEESHEH
ncbi:MAG: FoF1 ATP synthase subunit a [Candidatus Paceibacterota bacterium]